MKLNVGTNIVYSSAAGTRKALILDIYVGPTAKPGFMNTWLLLEVPVQPGVKFAHRVQITADDGSLKGYKVAVVD